MASGNRTLFIVLGTVQSRCSCHAGSSPSRKLGDPASFCLWLCLPVGICIQLGEERPEKTHLLPKSLGRAAARTTSTTSHQRAPLADPPVRGGWAGRYSPFPMTALPHGRGRIYFERQLAISTISGWLRLILQVFSEMLPPPGSLA